MQWVGITVTLVMVVGIFTKFSLVVALIVLRRLSGIDVKTQMLNQKFQEPWLAIVVNSQLNWACETFNRLIP